MRKNFIAFRWNTLKRRFYSTVQHQIFEIKEKPRKVALSCTLGVAINFFPTLGFGFLFAFLLAGLLKMNRAAAAVSSLVTAPLVPFMYASNFFVGGAVLAPSMGAESYSYFIVQQYSKMLKIGQLQEKLFGFLELFGLTFLAGALINASLAGVLFYLFVLFVIKKKLRENDP